MVRLHLVELHHYKMLEPLKGALNLNHFLHKKKIFSNCDYMKENFKNNKAFQKFQGEFPVDSQGNGDSVTLIHLMRNKPQIFTDEVLQCVFDKYVITYQNI